MAEQKEEKKGRGWHGDSAGHAKAGHLGGKARASKKQQRSETQPKALDKR